MAEDVKDNEIKKGKAVMVSSRKMHLIRRHSQQRGLWYYMHEFLSAGVSWVLEANSMEPQWQCMGVYKQ